MLRRFAVEITLLVIAGCVSIFAQDAGLGDFRGWNLQKAVSILTDSPWARQDTYTSIIGGIGSGISGQKEIYSTFFIRFLSARPIREAYARVRQIQAGYENLSEADKLRFDHSLEPGLNLDSSRWIVVTLTFRSNDPNVELRVKQFLDLQTTGTMKPHAYLSTLRLPQVNLAAYFPPRQDEVGAKFVFPRAVDGTPTVSRSDESVTFELEVPGFNPNLSVRFPVPDMLINDELVI